MIPFGILGILGDQFYLKGLKERNLLYLTIAKNVFPFEKEILVGPATLLFTSQVITVEAKDEIKDALKYDPYSIPLNGVFIQYALIFKDKYDFEFERLKKISPNSAMTKIIFDKLKLKE